MEAQRSMRAQEDGRRQQSKRQTQARVLSSARRRTPRQRALQGAVRGQGLLRDERERLAAADAKRRTLPQAGVQGQVLLATRRASHRLGRTRRVERARQALHRARPRRQLRLRHFRQLVPILLILTKRRHDATLRGLNLVDHREHRHMPIAVVRIRALRRSPQHQRPGAALREEAPARHASRFWSFSAATATAIRA